MGDNPERKSFLGIQREVYKLVDQTLQNKSILQDLIASDPVNGPITAAVKRFRRCKRKVLTNMESVPDDVVLAILLHLHPQDVYDLARFVCQKWYYMVRSQAFINAHFVQSRYGLLFSRNRPCFMVKQQGKVQISELHYKIFITFWSSCNGLILRLGERESYYIVNPITRQRFDLPAFFRPLLYMRCSGLAYAAASMEYKVVIAHAQLGQPGYLTSFLKHCAILTVGVDESWRILRTDHLSLTAREAFGNAPLNTEGFMHWVGDAQVLSLNVETEVIVESPLPIPIPVPQGNTKKIYCLSTGRCLTLLSARGTFLWEVWEMKVETGEWRKMSSINLEEQKSRFDRFRGPDPRVLTPLGWLEYPEFVVFRADNKAYTWIVYNLYSREIDSVHVFEGCSLNLSPLVHRSSFISLPHS